MKAKALKKYINTVHPASYIITHNNNIDINSFETYLPMEDDESVKDERSSGNDLECIFLFCPLVHTRCI